jgi:hypothetical protein
VIVVQGWASLLPARPQDSFPAAAAGSDSLPAKDAPAAFLESAGRASARIGPRQRMGRRCSLRRWLLEPSELGQATVSPGSLNALDGIAFAHSLAAETQNQFHWQTAIVALGARPDRGCDGHLLQVSRLRLPLRG